LVTYVTYVTTLKTSTIEPTLKRQSPIMHCTMVVKHAPRLETLKTTCKEPHSNALQPP